MTRNRPPSRFYEWVGKGSITQSEVVDKMKVTISWAVLVVLCAATTGALIQSKQGLLRDAHAQEQKGCDASTFQGRAGYYRFGTINDVGAYTEVGITDFDGQGNFTVHALIQSVAGVVREVGPVSATYTVNPDCTFSALVNGALFRGVIVDGGKEAYFSQTLDGLNIFGVQKKQ